VTPASRAPIVRRPTRGIPAVAPGDVRLGNYGETLVIDRGLAKVLGRKETDATESAPVAAMDSRLTQAGKAARPCGHEPRGSSWQA
jgi:hypothetical protein